VLTVASGTIFYRSDNGMKMTRRIQFSGVGWSSVLMASGTWPGMRARKGPSEVVFSYDRG